MTDRCEPPPELRGVDGWHWVQLDDAKPECHEWIADTGGIDYSWWNENAVGGDGWRYLSPVATPAEVATLRARVAELEGALRDIIADAAVPQELYDKIGPTWTGKDGHEYADMSYVLDKCTELSDIARAALSPKPTE